MSGRILVGTSSWADKSLIACGRFYPPDAQSPQARLRYYASQFPVVQNDAAWYALPQRRTVEQWVARTPPDFVFDVKLFRLFSLHQTPRLALPPDVRAAIPGEGPTVDLRDVPQDVQEEIWVRYLDAIAPLAESGKLGVIMVQLAPWIGPSRQARAHLGAIRARMPHLPLAVELRNPSWYGERQDRTFALLRDARIAHVVVDAPQGVPFTVPLVPEVTWPEVAILRLHGRNAATWARKGLKSSADRFNYEYSRPELEGLANVARRLAAEAKNVHVMFNVNHEDQGPRAAKAMMSLLAPPG